MKRTVGIVGTVVVVLATLFHLSSQHLFEAYKHTFEPICQLNSYKKAGMYWPLLYLNPSYTSTVHGLGETVNGIESSADMTVYFTLDAPAAQTQEVTTFVEAFEGVSSVEYVDRQKALEIYRELHVDDPLLLESVTADVLPESLHIRTESLDVAEELNIALQDEPIIEETLHSQNFKTECTE